VAAEELFAAWTADVGINPKSDSSQSSQTIRVHLSQPGALMNELCTNLANSAELIDTEPN
jgi:hypothetical protein